jgi:hypothetical protein
MSKKMLILELHCPSCKADLTHGAELRLDAHVRDTGHDGAIVLSAVFGDYTVHSDLVVPDWAIVDFRCPRCEQSVMLPASCRKCDAPMVGLDHPGGYIEFCSRRGCKGHALGGEGDTDQMMDLMNKMLQTPYD